MITIENLKEMEPGIFDKGMYQDDDGAMWRWVAVRGGIHDWAIYELSDSRVTNVLYSHKYEAVLTRGNKVHVDSLIKRLVPCTVQAFNMYRR